MARIYPDTWQQLTHQPEHYHEFRTLELLQGLPNNYVVIHGAHWTRLHRHYLISREIDFCVVTPSGSVIIIEQKNGHLIERDGQFFKRYGSQAEKNVTTQLLDARDGLKTQFKRVHERDLHCDVLLYCPDYRVDSIQHDNVGGLPPQRVVDQRRASELCPIIMAMNVGSEDNQTRKGTVRFLLGVFDMTLDVGQSLRIGGEYCSIFSKELTRFLGQLDFSPWWLRIQGNAGSGKTQLATQLLREAEELHKRALYICFNRPLVDRMRSLFPDSICIETRDSLADHFLRSQGITPQYGLGHQEDFARLRNQVMETVIPDNWRFDLMIIDEGQDFDDEDAQFFMYFMHEDNHLTRLLWLEDPLQNIYGKTSTGTICTVTYRNQRDFRCPYEVFAFTEIWLELDKSIEPMSPIPGLKPKVLAYKDATQQKELLVNAVRSALDNHVMIEDIVIVSLKGLNHHLLHADHQLQEWSLRRFTGQYTADGRQLWTEGLLQVDTIYRFKGQQAPWVIIVDAEGSWDELLRRKLYCALTRATFSATVLIDVNTLNQKERRSSS